jgi:hypothetical protein
MYAFPKHINISITITHLLLVHYFSPSPFSPVEEMTAILHFYLYSSTGLFIFFSVPFSILLFNFAKMRWVLWVPYYLLSFIKFDTFYDTLLSSLRITVTKRSIIRAIMQIRTALQNKSIMNEKGEKRTALMYHVVCPDLLRP